MEHNSIDMKAATSNKPRTVQLPAESVMRIRELLPVLGEDAFGVSASTLGRAMAGWGIAPGSLALINEALARITTDKATTSDEENGP